MYKDIISYSLADNISEEHLIKVASQIVNDWMKSLPGFISWEINTNSDGTYGDVVSWETKEAADNATKEMVNIPNAGDWYACYKEGSISSKKFSSIAKF